MASGIPWNDNEAAVLLQSLVDVLQNKIDRATAIRDVSKKLREYAVQTGLEIDEVYRNENGIFLQMKKLEYVYTGGKSGLPGASGWSYKIVDIYRNNPEQFEKLIQEFNKKIEEKTEGKNEGKNKKSWDQYFRWLSKRTSSAQLSDLYFAYEEIDRYFLYRGGLKKSVLETTDMNVLLKIRDSIQGDKYFKVTHKRNLNSMLSAIKYYIDYVGETEGGSSYIDPVPANYAPRFPTASEMPRVADAHKKNYDVSAPGQEKASSSLPPELARNYTSLLREEFPDGMKQNIIHVKKFIQKYEERFGDVCASQDSLLGQLREVGVVRNERIFAGQDDEQRSLADEIYEDVCDVFRNGGSIAYLSMVLARYAQRLAEKAGIYNESDLQAMLMERNAEGLLFRHGYICQRAAEPDPAKDVLGYMKLHSTPASYGEIQSELWYLPMDRIKRALVTTASLVKVDSETYFYAPNLPISANELQRLSLAMREEIDASGFLTSKELTRLIDERCPSASIDLANMKDWAIRNCLGYVLRDQFEFNGRLISRKGRAVSAAEVFRGFCQSRESLTLEELKEFSKDINLQISWDAVFSVMVRISPDEMRRADAIHFDVEKTDKMLDSLIDGDYMSIREIGLYLQFPVIEVPWNGFVLESYLKNYSERFQLFQVSVSENDYYGVVVRKESKFQGYEDVVMDMLAHSAKWKNENDALDLLVSRGFQARRRNSGLGEVVKKSLLLREEIEREK